MRLITLILATLFSCQAFSQAKAKFDCEDYDFGEVLESGGKLSHTFVVENVGNKPLVIRGIYVSCGCTTASHTKEAIKPGEKGEITVTFDPEGLKGLYIKTIFVHTNTKNRKGEIFIRATIVDKLTAKEEGEAKESLLHLLR